MVTPRLDLSLPIHPGLFSPLVDMPTICPSIVIGNAGASFISPSAEPSVKPHVSQMSTKLDPLPKPTSDSMYRFEGTHKQWVPISLSPLNDEQFQTLTGEGNAFGIYNDGRGNLTYPRASRADIIRYLGSGRVVEYPKWDLLIAGIYENKSESNEPVANEVILFPEQQLQKEGQERHALQLDYSQFQAESSRRVLFYKEGWPLNTIGSTWRWVNAMRDFGHNIIPIRSLLHLEDELSESRTDILMVSAVESELLKAQVAYFLAKKYNPSIITVLGGVSAIPELARFFDIVWQGEGEFFSLLLNELQLMLNLDELEEVRPMRWEEKIEGLDGFLNMEGVSEWVRKFAHSVKDTSWGANDISTGFYPPLFARDLAEQLVNVSARRYVEVDGERFYIDVPIGVDSRGSPRIFIHTADGIVASDAIPPTNPYEALKKQWLAAHPDKEFPFSRNDIPKVSAAMPQTSTEIDRLYIRDEQLPYTLDDVFLYAGRGCKKDPRFRCNICSIQAPAGNRRPSVDQVIKMMQIAIVRGQKLFSFSDDQFLQGRKWISDLADHIEEQGIHDHMKIRIMGRADLITSFKEEIDRLRNLGLSVHLGLETLLARRAERLGKAKEGGGRRYIERSKQGIALLARHPDRDDKLYMISAGIGDTFIDIAQDVLEQLKAMEEIEGLYGYVLPFTYNPLQNPNYNDLITPVLSGFYNAQPGSIPDTSSQDLALGSVKGWFVPFGFSDNAGNLHVDGIFMPRRYHWPEPIERFASVLNLLDRPKVRNIGYIYEALKYAYETSAELTSEEKRDLLPLLDEIETRYKRLCANDRIKKKIATDPKVLSKIFRKLSSE